MSKRKFTRDQARTALLGAGREMLTEVGLSGGVGRVTLAEAINRSGVPRPSAYRVFGETELDPQRSFHEELIVDITEAGPTLRISPLADPVRFVLSEVEQIGVQASPEELTWYLRELVRVAGLAASEATFTETPVGVYLSVLAATQDGEQNPRVEAAARHAEATVVEALLPFLRETLVAFGLRLSDGWTLIDVSSSLVNAILGSVLTIRVSPGSPQLSLPTGKDREIQAWAPLGTAILGLVGQATEPDPRMVSSAQPSQWFA